MALSAFYIDRWCFNNDITHSRVTTPVAAPTTAPATATAPASAVSGRSSGMAAEKDLHLALPPQTTPQTPSPGLSPLSHLQQPKTGGKLCIIKAHRQYKHILSYTSMSQPFAHIFMASPCLHRLTLSLPAVLSITPAMGNLLSPRRALGKSKKCNKKCQESVNICKH